MLYSTDHRLVCLYYTRVEVTDRTNALAYHDKELIIAAKNFIVGAHNLKGMALDELGLENVLKRLNEVSSFVSRHSLTPTHQTRKAYQGQTILAYFKHLYITK
jgi:hypothetical protein